MAGPSASPVPVIVKIDIEGHECRTIINSTVFDDPDVYLPILGNSGTSALTLANYCLLEKHSCAYPFGQLVISVGLAEPAPAENSFSALLLR